MRGGGWWWWQQSFVCRTGAISNSTDRWGHTSQKLHNSFQNFFHFTTLSYFGFGKPHHTVQWGGNERACCSCAFEFLYFCTYQCKTNLLKLTKVHIWKLALTWERCRFPAAWGCPSCARSSCVESTRSPAPRAHPRKGAGSPIRKESAWERRIFTPSLGSH